MSIYSEKHLRTVCMQHAAYALQDGSQICSMLRADKIPSPLSPGCRRDLYLCVDVRGPPVMWMLVYKPQQHPHEN